MQVLKYKSLKWQKALIVAVALALSFVVTAGTTLTALADPIPTCGGGATLVRPKDGSPPYCSCPKGQVLVTGPTNVCKSACPKGYTSGTDSSGQKYCNPPDTSSSTGGSTTGSNSNCTTGGANDPNCAVNTTKCSTSKDTITNCTDPAASGANVICNSTSCNLVQKYINPLITLLSALVGVAVTISIIIAGIQYGSSAGDPQKVSAAKNRIRNSVAALVALLFLYAFLQFLVPGGLFNR